MPCCRGGLALVCADLGALPGRACHMQGVGSPGLRLCFVLLGQQVMEKLACVGTHAPAPEACCPHSQSP